MKTKAFPFLSLLVALSANANNVNEINNDASVINANKEVTKTQGRAKRGQQKVEKAEPQRELTDAEKIDEIKGQLSSLVNDWYHTQKKLPPSESINNKEIFFLKAQEYFKKDIHTNLMNSKEKEAEWKKYFSL